MWEPDCDEIVEPLSVVNSFVGAVSESVLLLENPSFRSAALGIIRHLTVLLARQARVSCVPSLFLNMKPKPDGKLAETVDTALLKTIGPLLATIGSAAGMY